MKKCETTMPGDLPPPPVTCALSEQRQGSQVRIEAEIRSATAQSGSYRLVVSKRGSSGSAQVSQQSDLAFAAGTTLRISGPRLSIEPQGHYQARLVIRTGDADYTCEHEGPNASDPL
jgi:hypothetical protein